MRGLLKLAPHREACLFSVTDMPALQKLALYREEGRTRGGDIVRVAGMASHDHCERVPQLRQVLS